MQKAGVVKKWPMAVMFILTLCCAFVHNGSVMALPEDCAGCNEKASAGIFVDGQGTVAAASANGRQEKALVTAPDPHETWNVRGDIRYEGGVASGNAYVYLSDQNQQLTNPIIVVEGVDLDNSIGWDEIYSLLSGQGFLETLRGEGHDFVVLDFEDSLDYIQRNAYLLVKLIQRVNEEKSGNAKLVVIGASMGGLVARYALAYMDRRRMAHETRTFISFDSPHNGANIPLGVQHWLDFFSLASSSAATMRDTLNEPSPRQMLLYHFASTSEGAAHHDPLRDILMDELSSWGNYPSTTRNVSIINGSGRGEGLGFSPGTQLLRFRYNLPPAAAIAGYAWAVPDGEPETTIFYGDLYVSGEADEMDELAVSDTLPLDNAPGGSRNTAQQIADSPTQYGGITTSTPFHCFIPTISGLDLDVADPFYDVAADAGIMDKTPFHAIYYPTENQEHVTVTAENIQWFSKEILGVRLYFPLVKSYGMWETELCVVNPSRNQSLNGVFRAYDASGVAVSDGISVSLAPHGRREITVGEEFTDPENISYVVFEGDAPEGAGYVRLFVHDVYRVAVPAADKINTGDVPISHMASDENWATDISLVNLSGATKELTLEFNDGQTRQVSLGPGEHRVFTISELFEGQPQPGINAGVIRDAGGIVGLELFRFDQAGLMSGILLKEATARTMYYPHMALSRGWATGVVAFNASATACTLTITPYNGSGLPLSPSTVDIDPSERYMGVVLRDLSLPSETEWMAVSAPQPLTGFELFTRAGSIAGYTGVNISGTKGVFPKLDQDGATGISFVNVGDTDATVTLTAYTDSGSAVATKGLVLGPFVKSVDLASNLFAQDISTATYLGYTSDQAVVGFQLNTSTDSSMLDALPALR